MKSFGEWPSSITENCRVMMDHARKRELIGINQPYGCDSMLEIRPVYGNNQRWEMVLRKDPIQWYETCKKRFPKYQTYAKNYITKVLKECENSASEQPTQRKENVDLPKLYLCEEEICTDGNICSFYVYKDYRIKETDNYFAAARSNKTRIITISPRKHVNNEQWVELIQICQHRRTSVEIL